MLLLLRASSLDKEMVLVGIIQQDQRHERLIYTLRPKGHKQWSLHEEPSTRRPGSQIHH